MRYTTEPEFAAAEMAKMQTMFTESDANGDGLLDADEFAVFEGKAKADNVEKGGWTDPRAEMTTQTFNALNLVNTEEAGISYASW